MQRARDQLLPRAALAGDDHRAAERRDLADRVEQAAHRCAAPDHAVELAIAEQLAVLRDLGAQPARLQHPRDGEPQVIEPQRLGQEIVGAALQRLDGLLDRAEGGDHDEARRRVEAAAMVQQVAAAVARQAQVAHHEVRALPADHRARLLGVRRGGGPVARVLELVAQQLAQSAIVLDDQDPWPRPLIPRHRSPSSGRVSTKRAPPSGSSSSARLPRWSSAAALATLRPSPCPGRRAWS
jgi:hypothetical protein